MPLDDLAAGILHFLGRLLAQFFAEIVLELLIKGPGYLLLKLFFLKKHIDPDGGLVIFTGIIFWLLIVAVSYWIYHALVI